MKLEFQQRAQELDPWFHNFEVDGYRTRRNPRTAWDRDYPGNLWEMVRSHIACDVRGSTVLDVGCNAGYLSFEMEKLGAQVHGIDVAQPGSPDEFSRCIAQARLMAEVFGSQVLFEERDFLSLSGRYDIILFLGVYYHMPDHTLAFPKLDQLIQPGGCMVVESAVGDVPTYYDGRESVYHGDPTNAFVPSEASLYEDLRRNGFTVTSQENYLGDRVILGTVHP